MLKARCALATKRAGDGSSHSIASLTQGSAASVTRPPTRRFARLPSGTRIRAHSLRSPSSTGFSALPILAPTTIASAASGPHHAGRMQGGDEQHRGDRGMHRPGDDRGDQQVRQRQVGDRAEHRAQRRGGLDRRHHRDHHVQRQQHQPQPDAGAAQVAPPRMLAAAEGDDAGQDQQRRQRRDIEGQHLHDQRRADIGAEHRRQTRHQRHRPAGAE